MSEKYYWYGYLDAGEKSSPVLLDKRLNTGNDATLYLFHLKRGEILEYKRDIITPKLRENGPQAGQLNKTLKAAYIEARRLFTPRGEKAPLITTQAGKRPTAANDERLEERDSSDFHLPDMDAAWLEEEA